VSGSNLFVTNTEVPYSIGEYTTSGMTVNASLVSGLNSPSAGLSVPLGIAVSGGNLFVVNSGQSTIGEYNATTGATVDASLLVTGSNDPYGIAVLPEPSSVVLAVLGLAGFMLLVRRMRR
jgi:hypothetical protein